MAREGNQEMCSCHMNLINFIAFFCKPHNNFHNAIIVHVHRACADYNYNIMVAKDNVLVEFLQSMSSFVSEYRTRVSLAVLMNKFIHRGKGHT